MNFEIINNIQEYVVFKVIEHIDETGTLKKELLEKEKYIHDMRKVLKANNVCFECICDRCKKKIPSEDEGHSHHAHEIYRTLCYRCFFQLL
tara:strand:+ start:162 stop:434 length:273 start_codon:yes stop_codon:yes gene_type:complete